MKCTMRLKNKMAGSRARARTGVPPCYSSCRAALYWAMTRWEVLCCYSKRKTLTKDCCKWQPKDRLKVRDLEEGFRGGNAASWRGCESELWPHCEEALDRGLRPQYPRQRGKPLWKPAFFSTINSVQKVAFLFCVDKRSQTSCQKTEHFDRLPNQQPILPLKGEQRNGEANNFRLKSCPANGVHLNPLRCTGWSSPDSC